MRIPIIAAASAAAVCLAACAAGSDTRSADTRPASAPAPAYGNVDAKRLLAADQNAGQWMSTGRTYSEQRFSPLKRINTENVAQLGLAWYGDFDTNRI
jgi:quinohemoprotein ethanol dehydrogenase